VVGTERDANQIRAEIDKARDQLAVTVDQLTDRLAPQRLMDNAKAAVVEKATSPTGKKVLAAGGVLLTLLVIRNLRRSRR
jgi:F0F1-type ATP synthase membrane subunit b/b'